MKQARRIALLAVATAVTANALAVPVEAQTGAASTTKATKATNTKKIANGTKAAQGTKRINR
ncbi:hypothetical protein GCM10022226_10920 [Sphaerisporangium flaviroseum]|uniref:Uncharacterized protein n=1 Tax=Sphaerisporangium flaviroseum TaxID=509199 RepID=A0ABP7HJ06_9ACTN